jgi:hypothetical protein
LNKLENICWVSLLFTGSGKPLSKPLSCKERGFEFSPFRAKKSEASFAISPCRGEREGWEGGWGVRFDVDFSRWRITNDQ